MPIGSIFKMFNFFNKAGNNEFYSISKYKLIYYSPQLLPSNVYEKPDISKNNHKHDFFSNNQLLFTLDERNGSIYLHIPKNEPILEYLCKKKVFCSCQSCIFSLNIIFISENRVNAETIRVFIDDSNDFSPKFYEPFLNVNISETSQIGDTFRVFNGAAYDADVIYNKVKIEKRN